MRHNRESKRDLLERLELRLALDKLEKSRPRKPVAPRRRVSRMPLAPSQLPTPVLIRPDPAVAAEDLFLMTMLQSGVRPPGFGGRIFA